MDRDIMVETFLEFYNLYQNAPKQVLDLACPKHMYFDDTFCTDFCEAVPILMEDNPPIETGYSSPICPCFAFGPKGAMDRLRQFLVAEGAIA